MQTKERIKKLATLSGVVIGILLVIWTIIAMCAAIETINSLGRYGKTSLSLQIKTIFWYIVLLFIEILSVSLGTAITCGFAEIVGCAEVLTYRMNRRTENKSDDSFGVHEVFSAQPEDEYTSKLNEIAKMSENDRKSDSYYHHITKN